MPDPARMAAPSRTSPRRDLAARLGLGLVAGAAAVFVLDRIDWALFRSEDAETRQRTKAVRPGGEPPAHAAATRIEQATGLEQSSADHDRLGNLVHYAIGMAPAALYAAYRDRLHWLSAGRGGLFGLAMYLLQDQGLNTVTRLSARPRAYPWQDHGRGLVAHIAYGLALDVFVRLLGRREAAAAG